MRFIKTNEVKKAAVKFACLFLLIAVTSQAPTGAKPLSSSAQNYLQQTTNSNQGTNSSTQQSSNSGSGSNPTSALSAITSGLSSLTSGLTSGLGGLTSGLSGAASGVTSGLSSVPGATAGGTSIGTMRDQFLQANPEVSWLRAGNNAAMVPAFLSQVGGGTGQQSSDWQDYLGKAVAGDYTARIMQYPPNAANQAKANAMGQGQAMGNSMGDLAKSQAASAMSYCSGFLQNFTTDDSNRWNRIRNGVFIPMAILLLLPGAILTQFKAMVYSNNPVLSPMGTLDYIDPLEGILKAVVAIFLIPATYLVVNYGIDFSNSVTYSIAQTYKTVMGSNMYEDALSSEVRAFPVRTPKENQNMGAPATWPTGSIRSIADFERYCISNKVQDPSAGLNVVPPNKTDEAMPGGAVAARQLAFGANAALTASWNLLCAFQMAYLAFLFFVGPIAAAMWVWPMDNFKQALPNWIEGVITLCFWSMFWNTTILLMACFKGIDENGTMITSALNFLAVSSVKFAFDFAGLVQAAGAEAAERAQKMQQQGGGAAGKGGQGKAGKQGGAAAQQARQQAAASTVPGGLGVQPRPLAQPAALGGGGGGAGAPTDPSVPPEPPAPPAPMPAFLAAAYTPGRSFPVGSPNVPPPPTAPGSGGEGSVQLGNYTLTRGVNDQGQPVGQLWATGLGGMLLPTPIAEIPLNGPSQQSIPGGGGQLTSLGDGRVTLQPPSGQSISAQIPPATVPSAGPTPGMIDPKNPSNSSIALGNGMFLENGGRSVRMQDGSTYSLPEGQSQGTFNIGQGRNLTLAQTGAGQQISINGGAGGPETFTVRPVANNGGYGIDHSVGGQPPVHTQVANANGSTVYTKEGTNGHVAEIDSISRYQTSSTYFDPNGAPMGDAVTNYSPTGDSNTAYHDAQGHLVASTAQLCKPDGSSLNVVYDGNGQPVSSQAMAPIAGGGHTLTTSEYEHGSITHAQVQTYDRNSNLVSTAPADPASAAATAATFGVNEASPTAPASLAAALANGGPANEATYGTYGAPVEYATVATPSSSLIAALAHRTANQPGYDGTYGSSPAEYATAATPNSGLAASLAHGVPTNEPNYGGTYGASPVEYATAATPNSGLVAALANGTANQPAYDGTYGSSPAEYATAATPNSGLAASLAHGVPANESNYGGTYGASPVEYATTATPNSGLVAALANGTANQPAYDGTYGSSPAEYATAATPHAGLAASLANGVPANEPNYGGTYGSLPADYATAAMPNSGLAASLASGVPTNEAAYGASTVEHERGAWDFATAATPNGGLAASLASAAPASETTDGSSTHKFNLEAAIIETAILAAASMGHHSRQAGDVHSDIGTMSANNASGAHRVQEEHSSAPVVHQRSVENQDVTANFASINSKLAELNSKVSQTPSSLLAYLGSAAGVRQSAHKPALSQLSSKQDLTVKMSTSDLQERISKDAKASVSQAKTQPLTTDASAKPSRTFNDILKRMKSSNNVSEALASAHVNFSLLSSLLKSGKTHHAQQMLNVVLKDIEIIKHVEEARPLIESYQQLLRRHGLNAEAFECQAQPTAVGTSNPW